MPKVLISDSLSARAVEIFQERGVEVDVRTGLSPDALKAIIADYDGLAIRSSTKVTGDLLAATNRLKVVGRAGIGVDNVDIPAATARGVVVMNTPFGNSVTTAEHAIAMMMALARQIPLANASTQAGRWEKNRFMGVEMAHKVLGVIGCGNIGAIVADRALGLKMRVIAFDPVLADERATALGVRKVSLDELLAQADVITLHTPLTDQTRGILNAGTLAQAKKGVLIVNCARGGLIDEPALHEVLVSGHVGGAALDVFAQEPTKESPLFGLENVIATPHLGASTSEAQENVALQVAEQMADYLTTGAIINALNMPSISAEDAPRLRPYVELADRLGCFVGQLMSGAPNEITIEYAGHAAELNTRPLTQVILKGVLQPMLTSINMVNAPLVARERNITVRDVKRTGDIDYQTQITVSISSDKAKKTVSGTLFGGQKPRLVAINGIRVEAEIAPNMIYVRSEDRPGLVGQLGSALGAAGVNIATFHLGRSAPGENALSLLATDQIPPKSVISSIRSFPAVVDVVALRITF